VGAYSLLFNLDFIKLLCARSRRRSEEIFQILALTLPTANKTLLDLKQELTADAAKFVKFFQAFLGYCAKAYGRAVVLPSERSIVSTIFVQCLAYGDFIANRTSRWFLKIDDDAIISPLGLKRQIEWLESRYDPLTQVAAGANCLQFHLIQIQGGSGYIASRRLIEEMKKGAWNHFHSVQGDDRAVGSFFQSFWSQGWEPKHWSSPWFTGHGVELERGGDGFSMAAGNFSGLHPCPHPSEIHDTACANFWRPLRELAVFHPVKNGSEHAAALAAIENADPDIIIYSPVSQMEYLCRRPPAWRGLSKIVASEPERPREEERPRRDEPRPGNQPDGDGDPPAVPDPLERDRARVRAKVEELRRAGIVKT
jgi:hypothetical protein